MIAADRESPQARGLNKLLSGLVRCVRLNRVRVEPGAVIKRRNRFGQMIVPAANWFFRQCGAPIRFWRDVHAWQRWEVGCFSTLHPGRQALPVGRDSVCQERLPGESTWAHLRAGTLTPEILRAAGRELRRVHGLWSEAYGGLWSHGDGAMCNMLYDARERRCRMIDFELRHMRGLPAERRHADDLLAFLLDLAGGASNRQWLPLALTYLRAYGEGEATRALRQLLVVPTGAARVWFMIRTNFASKRRVGKRLAQLGRAMDHGALRPMIASRRMRRGARITARMQAA